LVEPLAEPKELPIPLRETSQITTI